MMRTLMMRLHDTSVMFSLFFFFFQAEDGIRDLTVTGVQTCALPIWSSGRKSIDNAQRTGWPHFSRARYKRLLGPQRLDGVRSEERRVGKECRSRWSPYH